MAYYVIFGLLATVIGSSIFVFMVTSTTWPPYPLWLAAWSVAEFVLYGLDKGLAQVGRVRVPELILHVLAALGGFAGGWLGMLAFRHKSNFRRQASIWIVLLLSTVIHSALIYYFLLLRE